MSIESIRVERLFGAGPAFHFDASKLVKIVVSARPKSVPKVVVTLSYENSDGLLAESSFSDDSISGALTLAGVFHVKCGAWFEGDQDKESFDVRGGSEPHQSMLSILGSKTYVFDSRDLEKILIISDYGRWPYSSATVIYTKGNLKIEKHIQGSGFLDLLETTQEFVRQTVLTTEHAGAQ
jgi:hypothetical protein